MLCSKQRRAHGYPEGALRIGTGSRLSRRALRIPASLPPISRRRIREFRNSSGLESARRMGLRPPDVSARSQRRLCRPLRRRLARRPVTLDPGLSARRPPFLAGRAPLDAHLTCAPSNSPSTWTKATRYDWPWLYAVQVGEWGLTDTQAKEMREYLLRGGFFMADDFHGNVRMGDVRAAHQARFPRPSHRGDRG